MTYKILTRTLNALVILSSIAIIVIMSIEILYPELLTSRRIIIDLHLVVSIIFMTDYFVRLYGTKHPLRFALDNFIFFVVALPFMSVIYYFELQIDSTTEFILRYMPFIRAVYGFVIVISYLTRSRITNLFYTYIVIVIATTYFCALLFYSEEKGVNSGVENFGDALWWSLMDMTTVGCDIVAKTTVGRVVSVVLAASGMMLFPIFTVYITDIFNSRRQ
ncbi:MAG: ion channel [Rikenellaceae bacterium]